MSVGAGGWIGLALISLLLLLLLTWLCFFCRFGSAFQPKSFIYLSIMLYGIWVPKKTFEVIQKLENFHFNHIRFFVSWINTIKNVNDFITITESMVLNIPVRISYQSSDYGTTYDAYATVISITEMNFRNSLYVRLLKLTFRLGPFIIMKEKKK